MTLTRSHALSREQGIDGALALTLSPPLRGESVRAIATPRVPTATPKGPAFLDWTKHQVGPLMPCRICRRKALLRDEHGRPCHKTCAEAELSKTFTEGNPTMSEGTS